MNITHLSMDKVAFRAKFGTVYEHSPWVADLAFDAGAKALISDSEALIAKFEAVFRTSGVEQQLDVLRAHPELACGRARHKQLTQESHHEQSSAGLDQCSEKEFMLFQEMNAKYYDKHNFPFIIAVKGWQRDEILKIFQERLNSEPEVEFKTAIEQVCRIARLRIEGMMNG